MPSPPWTTPDQDEFLASRLPDFLAAQRNKTTTEFWKAVYRDFFDTWTDPQDEVAAVIVPKKRKGKGRAPAPENQTHTEWVQLRKQQIYNWFNNRGSGATRRPVTQISLGGPSQSSHRLLSEINLYAKYYYDTRVRERAAAAWTAAQQDPKKPSRISVINLCLAKCWKEETEEIKQEIRKEYETLKAQKSQPIPSRDLTPPTAESYAVAQGELPPRVRAFIEAEAKRTGFCFTVLCGGPDPSRPSRMRILAFHEGVDRYGQKFGTSYASFNANVTEPFQKFLYNAFSEEERAGGVASQNQHPTENPLIPVEPPFKKHKIDDTAPAAHATSSSSTSIPTPAPTTSLLTPISAPSPATFSTPIPPASSVANAEAMSALPVSSVTSGGVVSLAPSPSVASIAGVGVGALSPSITVSSVASAAGATPGRSQYAYAQQVQSIDVYQPSPHVPGQQYPFSYEEFDSVLRAMELENDTVNPWELPQASTLYYGRDTNLGAQQGYHRNTYYYDSSIHHPVAQGPSRMADGTTETELSETIAPSPTPTVPATTTVAIVPSPTPTVPATTTVAIVSSPTPTVHVEPSFESSSSVRPPAIESHVVKGPLSDINLNVTNLSKHTEGCATDERPSRNRKPPISKDIQPNVWLDLAHGYLVKDIDDATWTSCIEKWFEFEKQIINDLDTTSRRIPANGRPLILSKWLSTRNYATIPKLDDDAQAAFATEWLHWWNAIQPKWRKAPDASSLPRSVDTMTAKDDLSCIKKFGPTGLVMVLIGLKWWAGTRGKDGLWGLAVADVLRCLGSFSQSTGSPSRRK